MAAKSNTLASKFCRCIQSVRKTVKRKGKAAKEAAAIAICVRSVLGRRNKTLKRFKCLPKPVLETQKL
jgi:hypothetical protein